MNEHRFFGYGSLVNLATHQNEAPRPARLPGWRRVWRNVSSYASAVLSVEPAESTLLGVTAQVPGGDWRALDAREAGYMRQPVCLDCGAKSAVYVVDPIAPGTPPPILLSYLDVIGQGYAAHYGPEGVAHFFETTCGWTDILDDRAAPRYPRHQQLSDAERQLVDAQIARLNGVRLVS